MVRAKFYVQSVATFGDGGGARVVLLPVYSTDPEHENKKFWNATPSGTIDMSINNPDAVAEFVEGQEYYVDFSPAE